MTPAQPPPTAEHARLRDLSEQRVRWRRWGPYLSERQWGTVREDYSANADPWSYLTHDQARSRAYRWGEDGLAGFSDEQARLCLSLALWNGRDPILKERLFGLTNTEGNHGEDVKELYYYLDATPTHSYLKMLYKYPQREFPYNELVAENHRRGRQQPEFELLDTGIFQENRYFDIFVEYAKQSPDDVLMLITVHNRGPDAAGLHVLPQLWFRNTWTWTGQAERPQIARVNDDRVRATHATLGSYACVVDNQPRWLFCENETNPRRSYGQADARGYFKDALHDYVVHGQTDAVNPAAVGTKAAAHIRLTVDPGASRQVRLRLTADGSNAAEASIESAEFDRILAERHREADAFYAVLQREIEDDDARNIQRQALAGMIWSKQFYCYDVDRWLRGDSAEPPPPAERKHGRNHQWSHLNNADIISMPDKWEYPWYAAWDLAFHCLPLALVDAEFAKDQLVLLTREWYMHPNGQLPAYEWAFGDVNPPVHAWAAWRVFEIDRGQRGDRGDLPFLERVFHKLLLNFTWWVNRKDSQDRNIFEGGFLGLDNIGVFDRSLPLPDGARLEQADATAWMAMYTLNMLRIALELALYNPVYEDIATKFFEHFLGIVWAMNNPGGDLESPGLWDTEDEFYYDKLTCDRGQMHHLKIRSMVGLIPLFAVEVLEPETLGAVKGFQRRLNWFLKYRPELASQVSRWTEPGSGNRYLLSILRGHRMKCLLRRMLDETEFLSDYGVRAMSRRHLEHPYEFNFDGDHLSVGYVPGESDSGMFGGNSNWRGPIWFPVNYLVIEGLQRFHRYYGDDFKVECPTGSGQMLTIEQIACELAHRLLRLFQRDDRQRRPVFGDQGKLQTDPHFRDYILFHEYFHGDTGRGLGASHQTGWTGLIAKLLERHPKHTSTRAT
jgi:hypothetical protein